MFKRFPGVVAIAIFLLLGWFLRGLPPLSLMIIGITCVLTAIILLFLASRKQKKH